MRLINLIAPLINSSFRRV